MTVALSVQAFLDYVFVPGTALGGSTAHFIFVFSGGIERDYHNTGKDLY